MSINKQFYKSPAWKYLSRFTLVYYSDGLFAFCFTCGKLLQINTSDCHCGHLIKLTDSKAIALEFKNLGPQCMPCNRYQGGKQDKMKDKLISIHGKEEIEKLYIKKHNLCKLDKFTMDYYAKYFKQEFEKLLKKRGIKDPWKR